MIYKITPRRYREKIELWLKLAGSKKSPKAFVNWMFSISFTLSFVVAIFTGAYFFFVWASVFVALFVLFHGFLVLAIDRRTRFVERILPDALQLTAANCRAGYIPSRALLMSARKEFGPLSDAVKQVGKEILTGKSVEEGLREMTRYIKSDILERSVKLIIEGVKGGGQFAALLEENASDIRRIQAIKKEIKSSIMMYTIFISFAGCLGAPILYALSSFLISAVSSFGAMAAVPETVTTNVPFMRFGGVEISSDFLFGFSLTAILITTVFGGIIVGLIDQGKARAGVKYIPIFVAIALVSYFLVGIVAGNLFGGMLPHN